MAQSLRKNPSLQILKPGGVHVDNFAHSGYLCADVEKVLRRVGQTIGKIDYVVLVVGAGDMIRWMEQATPTKGAESAEETSLFALHPQLSGPWWHPHRITPYRCLV